MAETTASSVQRTTRRKAGRRLNGEGTVSQRNDGRWEAKFTLPSGKRKTVYGPDAQSARAKMLALMDQQRMGLDLTRGRERLGPFLGRWLADIQANRLKPTSLRRYQSIVAVHLVPDLGNYYLDQLAPGHVQRMLNEKSRSGLEPATVKYIRDVLRSALSQAMRWSLVTRNVAKLVTLPKLDAKRVVPLDPDQARRFLTSTEGTRYGTLYEAAMLTGLRQGELLALRWSELDLDRRTLTVARSLAWIDGEAVFTEPKSKTSRRTIPLAGAAVAAFRTQSDRQAFERRKAGDDWQDGHLVFTRPDGRPIDGREVTKRLQGALKAADLPPMTFHGLRHGCASLLLAQGVPLSTVKVILGHSTITLTMNTYAHLFPEVQREAARAMDALFLRQDAV